MKTTDENLDPPTFVLAPSDLGYLFDGCKRCFYLKVVRNQRRPRTAIPPVFTTMDRQQREFFHGKRTSAIHHKLPPGVADCTDARITSRAIAVPGHDSTIGFRGAIDTLLQMDDGTFGLVDFKTTELTVDQGTMYRRQLHAYVLTLENPTDESDYCGPVSLLGLLCFTPTGLTEGDDDHVVMQMAVTWHPQARNDEVFFKWLAYVLSILERPEPPQAGERCEICAIRGVAA